MKVAVSNKVMRISDENTIKCGTDSKELMLRAGRGIFKAYGNWGNTCVVCGTGNNGGDGFVIALAIHENGGNCRIVLVEDKFSEDGRYYFEKCVEKGIEYEIFSDGTEFSKFDTLADCIFGTGFRGKVSGNVEKCIERMNKSGAYIVSADINSGISGDSGLGDISVISDLTVAVQFYKLGHFIGRSKDVMKSKKCIDIGISLMGEKVSVPEKADFKDILRERENNCHKGNFGYTAIIGGCREYSGAVKLSNMALSALKSGCGVTKLCVAESVSSYVAPYLLESTLFVMPDEDGSMIFHKEKINLLLKGTAAVSCGMGWGNGKDNGKILSYIIENYEGVLIIDADGINALSKLDKNILSRTSCKKIILTPHPLEFSRISGYETEKILSDPVGSAKEYLKDKNGKVILLLKGAGTVIAGEKEVFITDTGCAGVATAGSGDVLSGILTGLMGYCEPDELSVSCAAYISGLAGEFAQESVGDICMTSSDTVKSIHLAVKELRKGF